jgi:hypothetical protein
MSRKKAPCKCEVCFRPEGDVPDGPPPLGELERCDLCGRLACPDCLHEADRCFADWEGHRDDRNWAPKGWRRKTTRTLFDPVVEYERE